MHDRCRLDFFENLDRQRKAPNQHHFIEATCPYCRQELFDSSLPNEKGEFFLKMKQKETVTPPPGWTEDRKEDVKKSKRNAPITNWGNRIY